MPERIERIEEKKETKDAGKLVELTVSTMQEMERSLQAMRNELAALTARMPSTQLAGLAGFGMPGPMHLGEAQPQYPSPGGLGFAAFAPAVYGLGPGAPSLYEATPPGSRAFGRLPWGTGSGAPNIPGASPPDGEGTRLARELKNQPPVPRVPQVDLFDDGNEYTIRVDLPGVKKDQLDVRVSTRLVTVNAEAQAQIDVEDGTIVLSERGPIHYRRTIPLPTEVHSAQCKATLRDGILTLKVTKKVPGEAPRHVDVAYG